MTLLAPAVVEKLLADTDASINLDSVLRRAMPLDWQEQGGSVVGAVVIASRAQLGNYGWRGHCRGLFQIPVLA